MSTSTFSGSGLFISTTGNNRVTEKELLTLVDCLISKNHDPPDSSPRTSHTLANENEDDIVQPSESCPLPLLHLTNKYFTVDLPLIIVQDPVIIQYHHDTLTPEKAGVLLLTRYHDSKSIKSMIDDLLNAHRRLTDRLAIGPLYRGTMILSDGVTMMSDHDVTTLRCGLLPIGCEVFFVSSGTLTDTKDPVWSELRFSLSMVPWVDPTSKANPSSMMKNSLFPVNDDQKRTMVTHKNVDTPIDLVNESTIPTTASPKVHSSTTTTDSLKESGHLEDLMNEVMCLSTNGGGLPWGERRDRANAVMIKLISQLGSGLDEE